MTKYQKLLSNYESSGLSQKDFALRIGKSASSVCTMLKRARIEQDQKSGFHSIEIQSSTSDCIRINLANGTQIEIPI
jgi:Transcriptional regulator, contains sigma factor-related N-terminal domain